MGNQQTLAYYAAARKGLRKPKYPAWKVLQEDMWRGRPAYILGGGPSLPDQAWLAKREQSIGINMAFTYGPKLSFFGSTWVMAKLANSDSWKAYTGIGMTIASISMAYHSEENPKLHVLSCMAEKRATKDAWATSLKEGLPISTNSGTMMINLAEILGADPIILLGFDMGIKDGKRNYHSEYHRKHPMRPDIYKTYAEDISRRTQHCKSRIITCTEGTILPFEYLPASDVAMQFHG